MKAEDAVEHLEKNGLRASCLPFARMKDARKDLEDLRDSGALLNSFFDLHLKNFKWDGPDGFNDAKSVIVVSMAVPMIRTSFTLHGEMIPALVPPTYAGWRDVMDKIKGMLTSFAPEHRFEYTFLPLKTLATRSGLARYGRNNITYVEGFGSFQRLAGFATDLECGSDRWSEKRMLDRCQKCTTCSKVCPTQAIQLDRFLLHGERCLTHLNELPAKEAFPDFVKPEMHNAIVGCMICQRKCPEDRKYVGFIEERPGFSESETMYLLKGDFSNEKKAKAMEKRLATVGLDLTLFPRNLAALIESDRYEEPMGIPG